jgi:hypothetical protein
MEDRGDSTLGAAMNGNQQRHLRGPMATAHACRWIGTGRIQFAPLFNYQSDYFFQLILGESPQLFDQPAIELTALQLADEIFCIKNGCHA